MNKPNKFLIYYMKTLHPTHQTGRLQQTFPTAPANSFSPPSPTGSPQFFHQHPNKPAVHPRRSVAASSQFLQPTEPQFHNMESNPQFNRTPVIKNNATSSIKYVPQSHVDGRKEQTVASHVRHDQFQVRNRPPQVRGGPPQVRSSPSEAIGVPPKPESTNRIEYVYYDTYHTEYEQQQVLTTVQVPVQKTMLNHYAVEHIVEYVPQEIDDFRVEMVPEEIIHKRLQYVPVEEEIIHLPQDRYRHGSRQSGHARIGRSGLQSFDGQQKDYIHSVVSTLPNRGRQVPKTNFVTSDGYVPFIDEAHERRIQQIIAYTEKGDVGANSAWQENNVNLHAQPQQRASMRNKVLENSREY